MYVSVHLCEYDLCLIPFWFKFIYNFLFHRNHKKN